MKNRNVFLFVIGSVLLLAGQFWLTAHYQKQAPPPAPQGALAAPIQEAAPKPDVAAVAIPAASAAAPESRVAPSSETHTITTKDLKLTWQVSTGALKQVIWVQDGTEFFPASFSGLGGLKGQGFESVADSVEAGQTTVTFGNSVGEQLRYVIPGQGYVINVRANSPKNAPLDLIENPTSDEPVKQLGRVFTLNEKAVTAVTWIEMLHDPFFSFLGAKRKVLPPTSDRLGMDAGIEPGVKSQRSHYFAALWKLPRLASRDASGYQLLPQDGRLEASLYLGPKQAGPLSTFEKPFTKVVDYGFFGAVAQLFFWVLQKVHALIGNWGWSIVLVTLIIRLATWQLNTKQTINMLRMKDFEPHQKAIQAKYEKFGSDMTKKAEMQKELMELYKKNGHNPMGGCLPMLLQMPIFLAFWSMLNAVFELRHAPFFGWITDLSVADHYFVFPVLMGASMFVQQVMTPAVGDPAQRKMMLVLMPVMMTVMFAKLPVGVIIYYFASNLIGILQTWWVLKTYQPQPITA